MSSEKELLSNSYLFGSNAPYVEELYEAYLDNPGSIAEQWRTYFDHSSISLPPTAMRPRATRPMRRLSSPLPSAPRLMPSWPRSTKRLAIAGKQLYVQSIIAAYRSLGVRFAELDPLKRRDRPIIPNSIPRSTA